MSVPPRRAARAATLILISLGAFGLPSAAQDRQVTPYAYGILGVSTQEGPTGVSPQTYLTAPGGNTFSWGLGAGLDVAPALSVEFALTVTGKMTAREPSRWGMTFNEERRNLLLALQARTSLLRHRRVALEPVGGIGLVIHDSWSQTDRDDWWSRHVERGPRRKNDIGPALAFTFGCDARIGNGKVAFVPSVRFTHERVGEDSAIRSAYPGGYPRFTTLLGAGVRVVLGP